MASGIIWADSKLREGQRWGDASKVYTRRKLKNDSASTATAAAVDADNTLQQHQTPSPANVIVDDSSSHNPPSEVVPVTNANRGPLVSRVKNRVRVNLEKLFPKDDVRMLRKKLIHELDQVRNLVKQIEAKEIEVTELSIVSVAVHHDSSPSRQLSVSVVENNRAISESIDKEKRTPKANQYYSSEFLLGKDRLPPKRSKKSKSSSRGRKHSKQKGLGFNDPTNQALKSCNNLVAKLLKHKYGWVFEKPVDAKALGLRDYHDVIKHPMDLGTIKNKLATNQYKTPLEFAEDVRLTFSNAMIYNPKGQDVHIMAEELSKMFEEDYADLEVLFWRHSRKVQQPVRTFERSESILPLKGSPSIGRAPAPKRPKAKDPNKRDMTYEEKQKLSTKLQGLPVDKMDGIVQIIKKRNTQVSQHDDEIEVDIDTVDAETLWELDRFVTNYKKTLSKYRRRDELAGKAVDITANPAAVTPGVVAGNGDVTNLGQVVPQGDNVGSSSSDSSSSRDSDSESSSDGPDEELKLT